MFSRLLKWLRGFQPQSHGDPAAPNPVGIPTTPQLKVPRVTINGALTHKKVYTFGVTQSGQSSTQCRICGAPGQHVFSICVDAANIEHRCCIWCLRRFGGTTEVQRASQRSRYIRRVAECIEALERLRAEFPDPERRPYGEKSLLAEIALPFMGYDGIERVISKVHDRKWTDHDLAKIESRPMPKSDA